jgi:hypothetical protein
MTHRDLRRIVTYVTLHPWDALPLLRSAWRLRRRQWWFHAPFLPLSSSPYWEFRMMTATGSRDTLPTLEEMVAASKWSIRQRVGR